MTDWQALVDEIWRERNNADPGLIRQILKLDERQEAEMLAARGNMTRLVAMLHDPASQMIDLLFRALSDGKLCVVDVSQMRGSPALALSALLLRRIFDHNQEEFTKALPATIPTIAVVEEAQSLVDGVDANAVRQDAVQGDLRTKLNAELSKLGESLDELIVGIAIFGVLVAA